MFTRPDFVNLVLASGSYYYFSTKTYSTRRYRGITVALLLSEIYDSIWLYVYFNHWLTDDTPDSLVHRFAVLIAVTLFLAKIAIAFIFWRNTIRSEPK